MSWEQAAERWASYPFSHWVASSGNTHLAFPIWAPIWIDCAPPRNPPSEGV